MTADMQIDSYLTALRFHLGPLTIAEREEIVREIGAHVRDSAEESGASVDTILARLGPAEELAAQYRDGLLIRKATRSNSPLMLLRAALRLATKGIFGTFVLFLGLFGYLTGGSMVLAALVKPIFPAHTGVWLQDGVLVSAGIFVFGQSSLSHEVLGLWLIPIGLTAGSLLLFFTNFAIRRSLRVSQRWQARL
jgi:uncharacterized membrane protein